jgi:hypothetical protein
MSDEELAKVMADFWEWSGGFKPQECSKEEVQRYLDLALPTEYAQHRELLEKEWLK